MKHVPATIAIILIICIVIAIGILLTGCSKGKDAPLPSSTSLKLTVIDETNSSPVQGAIISLFGSAEDQKNGSNVLQTLSTDMLGAAIFPGLAAKQYFYTVQKDCKTNHFRSTATTGPLQAGVINPFTTYISPTGTIKLVNNSSHPFRIEINGVTVIPSQPGGSTMNIKMTAGTHNLKVVQLSGGTMTGLYTGNLICGGTLTAVFP